MSSSTVLFAQGVLRVLLYLRWLSKLTFWGALGDVVLGQAQGLGLGFGFCIAECSGVRDGRL